MKAAQAPFFKDKDSWDVKEMSGLGILEPLLLGMNLCSI